VGAQTYTPATFFFNASGGTTNFNNDAGSAAAQPVTLTVTGATTHVNFNSTQHLGSLSASAGQLAIGAGADKVLYTKSLSLTGARLDMNDNRAIVHVPAAQSAAVRDALEEQARQGRNPDPGSGQGRWDGATGLVSSVANTGNAAAGIELYGVVVIRNGDVADLAGLTPQSTFGGIPVGADDVLVRYSYAGDANADGLVNGDDYTLIDLGFAIADNRYVGGDFTFDGVVNGDDYTIIDLNYAVTGGGMPVAAGVPVAVPEPGALTALLLVATLTTRRRRPARV
jgi:hypothetical protein